MYDIRYSLILLTKLRLVEVKYWIYSKNILPDWGRIRYVRWRHRTRYRSSAASET